MKRFLTTLALTCVLSGSALAGDIDTCGITSGDPTTVAASPGDVPSTDSSSPGDMPTCGLTVLLTILDLAF